MKRKATQRSSSAVGHKQPAAVAVAATAAFPVDLLVLPGACLAPSWETLTPCDTLTPPWASPPPFHLPFLLGLSLLVNGRFPVKARAGSNMQFIADQWNS